MPRHPLLALLLAFLAAVALPASALAADPEYLPAGAGGFDLLVPAERAVDFEVERHTVGVRPLREGRGGVLYLDGALVGVDLEGVQPAEGIPRIRELRTGGSAALRGPLSVLCGPGVAESIAARGLQALSLAVRSEPSRPPADHGDAISPRCLGALKAARLYVRWETGFSLQTLLDLVQLAPWLHGLTVASARLTEGELALVGRLVELRVLGLRNLALPAAGLRHLSSLRKLLALDLGETAVTDEALAVVRSMPRLRQLSFVRTAITDAGLRHVSGLTDLEALNFVEAAVAGPGLLQLFGLRKLRRLHAGSAGFSGSGLSGLASLASLRELWLAGAKIGDQDLKHLSGLTQLRSLRLDRTGLTGKGLAHLSRLTGLSDLSLTDSAVDDEGLAHLGPLSRLVTVSLWGTRIVGPGLRAWAHHPTLESLILGSTRLTDAGLAHVFSCRNLRALDLTATAVTDAGLQAIPTTSKIVQLGLKGVRITDRGLLPLSRMRHLATLDVSETAIADPSMRCLAALGSLRSLDLQGTSVTARGIRHLRPLRQLGSLWVTEGSEVCSEVCRSFPARLTSCTCQHPAKVYRPRSVRIGRLRRSSPRPKGSEHCRQHMGSAPTRRRSDGPGPRRGSGHSAPTAHSRIARRPCQPLVAVGRSPAPLPKLPA